MSVTFQSGATQVTLRDPEFENLEAASPKQARGRTASGVLYVYDKGVEVVRMTLRFAYLSEDEKDDLDDFYRNKVVGSKDTFDLTDHKARSWTARFLEEIEFAEARHQRWDCTIVMEVEAAS